jgi:hypothetical protein
VENYWKYGWGVMEKTRPLGHTFLDLSSIPSRSAPRKALRSMVKIALLHAYILRIGRTSDPVL